MAFRFRRTFKIAPGLQLNLGKKNVSVRAGGRGLGITAGTAGKTLGAGIPGTGLHYRKKLDGKQVPAEAQIDEPPAKVSRSRRTQIIVWILGALAVLFLLAVFT